VLRLPGLNATEWGQQMKKLLLVSTAAGALAMAGPALAADIPVKAPPVVAPVPVFTWTGCYIGGHGGFATAQKYYEVTTVAPGGAPALVGTVVGEGGTFILPTGFTSFSHDPFGAFGGGQVGCQYQWDKWVIGIEGSFSGANIAGDSGGINLPFQPNVGDKFVAFHSRTDWFASVTGKFGYTGGRWLVYSKAGVAWDHTKYFGSGFVNDAIEGGVPFTCTGVTANVPNCTFNMSASSTRIGWTTGVGIEFAALPWLTIFLEYDHYDFGKKTLHFNGAFCEAANATGCTDLDTFSGVPLRNKQQMDTIRLGFNWLFNWGKAPTPVVARY
jgi:outer membrane immunogenic protein